MVIRPQQMDAFEQDARRRFEDEMLQHSKEFAPPLCRVLGDDQVRTAIRSAISRAETYGFTLRGPTRLFIEMMFLCGSGFDTDPQYVSVGRSLRSSTGEMQRAQTIHELVLDNLAEVAGPDGTNVHKALCDLLTLARGPLPPYDDFVPGMLGEMHRVFPQKAAFVGDANLQTLIYEGIAEAERYRFYDVRHKALIVVLKFSFGQGCTDDPLYPWISRTLNDEKIVTPEARAARLEKKAITWLEHVIARNQQGIHT